MNLAVQTGFTVPWMPPGRAFSSFLEEIPSNSINLKVWILSPTLCSKWMSLTYVENMYCDFFFPASNRKSQLKVALTSREAWQVITGVDGPTVPGFWASDFCSWFQDGSHSSRHYILSLCLKAGPRQWEGVELFPLWGFVLSEKKYLSSVGSFSYFTGQSWAT